MSSKKENPESNLNGQSFIDPEENLKLAIVDDELEEPIVPGEIEQTEHEQSTEQSQPQDESQEQVEEQDSDTEEDAQEEQDSQLSPEELEALEATAAGESGNNGHDTTFFIGFGDFSQPTSVPQVIGIPGVGGNIEFQELQFVALTEDNANNLPSATDDMAMDYEPLRCPCNIVIVIDVSKSMILDENKNYDPSQLELAKKSAIAALDQYDILNVPLNITIIPFASNKFFNATRTEFFNDDLEGAKDFVDDLNVFHEFLGPFTEYDDALKETKNVLEGQLADENLEGYQHKVIFISDAEPTEGNTGNDYPQWQVFLSENPDIDVLGVVIDPEIEASEVNDAYESIVNPGDTLAILEDMEDIEDVLFPNLPAKPIYIEGGNLLDNDTLGDPPTVITSICFCVTTMEEAELYAAQVEEGQSSIVANGEDGYKVILNVPNEGLTVQTLLGGMFEVQPDGQYTYLGPAINIPPGNLTETIKYTITDSNGDSDSAELMIVLKDTVPEAFDNFGMTLASKEGMWVISDFSEGFDGWKQFGHEHPSAPNQPVDTAFLSNRSGHGENVESENDIAQKLWLGSSSLDQINGNAKEGSIIYRDVDLQPGQEVSFDYLFATDKKNTSTFNDFGFISLSNGDTEIIAKFADTFDVSYDPFSMDNASWKYSTGWENFSIMIPYDWEPGEYRLGFGVMNVVNSFLDFGKPSMILLDDIKHHNTPYFTEGNVIEDPNTWPDSQDPQGAVDILKADGGKVSQISVEVDDAAQYIADNNLGVLGATIDDDGRVVIPIPQDGTDLMLTTPLGGTLLMNEDGDYRYFSPVGVGPVEELVTYRVTDWDGSFDEAILALSVIDADVMKMDVENDRPCCNLVFVIDVSGSINSQELGLMKDSTNRIIDQYRSLDYKLNITIIPFASGPGNDGKGGARVFRTEDADDAKDYVDTLQNGFDGLGNDTEFDDALLTAQEDVLEADLVNLPGWDHKLYFFSDGKPDSGNKTPNGWQDFIDDNDIDAIAILVDLDGNTSSSQRNNTKSVGNSGDDIVIISDMDDAEKSLVDTIVLPDFGVHFEECDLLDGVNPEGEQGPWLVAGISLKFTVDDFGALSEAEINSLLMDEYEDQLGAEVTVEDGVICVHFDIPEESGLTFNTPFGGQVMVSQDGTFSYWGPDKNFEENFTENYTYHLLHENGMTKEAPLQIIIKDTEPTAYDNARFIETHHEGSGEFDGSGDYEYEEPCPCVVFERFNNNNDLSDWEVKGHEHIRSYQGSSRLLMSTYKDNDHGSNENLVSENTLAGLILLDNSTLDNIIGGDAKFGSVVWQDIEFNPGEKICFDYNFFTNDDFKANERDYAFVSVAGMGQEAIYKFTDVFDLNLSTLNQTIDDVKWNDSTGWLSTEFFIPHDWEAGTYRLAFGVMDVNDDGDNSPKDRDVEASMVMIDNIGIQDAKSVQGNVILDPNEDVVSHDPVGAKDIILADGGKVSEISFKADDADDFIDDYNLDSQYGAFSEGDYVRIPVPMNGDKVGFETPEGGYLNIDQYGNYEYFNPQYPDEAFEQFEYKLSEWDGNDSDTANLTFYFLDVKQPSQDEDDPSDTKVFKIDFDDKGEQYLIKDLNEGDLLRFSDVLDQTDPVGGAGQPDIDDVVTDWSQQGNDVVVGLANSTVLVFQGVGTIENVGPTPGQTFQTFVEDTLHAAIIVQD